MFEHLFKSERALARHRDAPLAEERARYIQHCIERGSTPLTVELQCGELLWAARLIQDEHRLTFNKECLHALAVRRSAGQRGDPARIQERFENIALQGTGIGVVSILRRALRDHVCIRMNRCPWDRLGRMLNA